MKIKSTAEQRHEFVARQKSFDPEITKENYNVDLIRFQNHHNRNTDMKVIRSWALDYVKKTHPKIVDVVAKANDFELRTIGMIARAISKDYYIALEHIVRIDDEIKVLLAKYGKTPPVQKKQEPTTQPVEKEDKNVTAARTHAAEVQGAIDDFVESGAVFSMKEYIAKNNINGPTAKLIGEKFGKLEAELQEAVEGKCDQLIEAYSFMGKVRLKKFYALVQQIILDCQQQIVTAKVRKPRAKKEKPPSVQVAKLRYQRKDETLNLTSEKPETIIGASVVWLFDTERRKMTVYVADDWQKLGVHGTTITGFSVKESQTKIVRKPEELLTAGLAKRTIKTNFDALKTKPSTPNGRTNESTIILKVF